MARKKSVKTGKTDDQERGFKKPLTGGLSGRRVNDSSTGKPKKPVSLTNKFVSQLAGPQMWWDSDSKATGFGVRSYAGGGRSFFIDYRLNGRQGRYTIGPFPRWSVEAAREEAKKLRKQIDRGFDPAGNKRERRTAPTVQ